MQIREEVPIRSFSIGAYLARPTGEGPEFLLLKRKGEYLKDTWQMVTGMIEQGEAAWQAALREIKEETGIVPDRLYGADVIETFYLPRMNCINITPIFLGICEGVRPVVLRADEHSEFMWLTAERAAGYLAFSQQIQNLFTIEKMFFQRTPREFLRIEM